MYTYIFIVLCYCIGVCLLWIDPLCAEYQLVFFICSSISVGLLCYDIGKKSNNHNQKIRFIDIVLNGFMILLGIATAYLILIDFYKEEPLVFILLVLLFIINLGGIIIWNRRKGESD